MEWNRFQLNFYYIYVLLSIGQFLFPKLKILCHFIIKLVRLYPAVEKNLSETWKKCKKGAGDKAEGKWFEIDIIRHEI